MALCTFTLLTLGDAIEQDTSLPIWGATTPTLLHRRATRLVRLGWLAPRAAQATDQSLPYPFTLSPDPWPDRTLPAALLHPTTKTIA